MEYKAAKCPSCGASIQVPDDTEKLYCSYCGNVVIAQAAIAYGKLEISGTIASAEKTSAKYIDRAMKFLELEDYNQAHSILDEASKLYPENYEIWWGLILASTSRLNPYIDRRYETDKWFSYVEKTAGTKNIDDVHQQYCIYTTNLNLSDVSSELSELEQSIPKSIHDAAREYDCNVEKFKTLRKKYIHQAIKFFTLLVLLLVSITMLFTEIGVGYKLLFILSGIFSFFMLSSYSFSMFKYLVEQNSKLKKLENLIEKEAIESEEKIIKSKNRANFLREEMTRLQDELDRLNTVTA